MEIIKIINKSILQIKRNIKKNHKNLKLLIIFFYKTKRKLI